MVMSTLRGKISASLGDRIFIAFIYMIVTCISVAMLYPLLNVLSISLSSYRSYITRPLMFYPTELDFNAFKYVFTNRFIGKSNINTIFVTAVGTALGMFLTALTAYPLSRKGLRGKKIFMTFYIIIMLFPGGIIPEFLVIQGLHLYDTLWALILPSLIPIYNLVLMKSFFESIPESLIEAAKMDGATETYTFFRIVVPLSKPALAAIALFLGVAYWNDFFKAVIFIRSQEKWPLQLLLREIIANAGFQNDLVNPEDVYPLSIRYASLIVVILPILAIYPFIQKYFVKGVMIGAVKG